MLMEPDYLAWKCVRLSIQMQCKVNYSSYSTEGTKVPFLTVGKVDNDSNTSMSAVIRENRNFLCAV